MTLTTRLSVVFLTMLALVLMGFSVGLYLLADGYLHRQIDERLDTVLNTISGAVETGPSGVEWEPANRHLNLDFSILGDQVVWFVTDGHGQVVDRSKGRNTEDFLSESSVSLRLKTPGIGSSTWVMASWEAGQRWIHADTEPADQVQKSQTKPHDDGPRYPTLAVTAGVSLVPIRTTLRQLTSALVGLSVGVWLLAFVASRFVCRRALLPVNLMAVAAAEIDTNDLTQRLPAVTTKDELEHLNRAFNNLLDRLQITVERQRNFTGDASHQLRTPLTVILGQIEVALRRERPAEEYRDVLATVRKMAGHLSRMVESLLFLARADSESRYPALESLDLAEWLPLHLQTWSRHARTVDLDFECTSSTPCQIDVQPALLGELLNILIDNACKYSEQGTPIRVRLEKVENAVCVKIEDQGCGIDDNDLANLFVPFCRSAEARRRGIEGVGLGLSIAIRLAEVFGGTLTVMSRPNQGSCFTLRFACRS